MVTPAADLGRDGVVAVGQHRAGGGHGLDLAGGLRDRARGAGAAGGPGAVRYCGGAGMCVTIWA